MITFFSSSKQSIFNREKKQLLHYSLTVYIRNIVYGVVRLDCLQIIFPLNGNGKRERNRKRKKIIIKVTFNQNNNNTTVPKTSTRINNIIHNIDAWQNCLYAMDRRMNENDVANGKWQWIPTPWIHVYNNKNDEKRRKVEKIRKKVWAQIFLWITFIAKTPPASTEIQKKEFIHLFLHFYL